MIAYSRVKYLNITNLGKDIAKNPGIWRIALAKNSFLDKLTKYLIKKVDSNEF